MSTKLHINLLTSEQSIPPFQTHRSPVVPLMISCSLFFLLLGATAAFSYQNTKDEQSPITKTWNSFLKIPPMQVLANQGNNNLSGTADDRINILIMGIGGANHGGGDLTDTMILASIRPSNGQVALFSIPRDLLVEMDNYGWRKINNANAFGEMAQKGSGSEYARSIVSRTFDIPIQYYFRIDFQGFVDVVNILGGVTVTVDNSFNDYTYPTYDEKIQTVSFKTGTQTMDGERALEYSRSRHSLDNNEGSDFSRSKRQEKVLLALKEKIFSSSLLFRPQKIADIISAIQTHISTNLQNWQILTMGNAIRKIHTADITRTVFDDGVGGYLVSNMLNGAYVLQPKTGNFLTMQDKVKNIFDEVPTQEDVSIGKDVTVSIRNGTLTEGVASRTASFLKASNFTIESVGNALNRDYQNTVIFDLTKGKKSKALAFLKKKLVAQDIYDPYSKELDNLGQTDFLVILGTHLPAALETQDTSATQ